MLRNPGFLSSARSTPVVELSLIAAALTVAVLPGAVAQPGDAGSERAPAISAPAPLPTREQILSDPFLRNALSRSTEGLEAVRRPDGTVMIDLQGRFQSISAARINDNGEVEVGCAEIHDSLADFLAAHPPETESVAAGGPGNRDESHE